MKTILFELSNLSFRGTTLQTIKYAHYNQTILGNKSIITFDSKLLNEDNGPDSSKAKEIVKMFSDEFLVVEYENKEALEFISKDCDYKYLLKYGVPDEHDVKSCNNLNHVVFNCNQPHGHRYSYISKWLAKAASGDETNYVPHIIDLPIINTKNLRDKLKIKETDFVISRIGGFTEFDIRPVWDVINYITKTDDSIKFIFVNTKKVLEHKNIFYIDNIIDENEKCDFINSSDCMIHARARGESFGIAIAEFLQYNKPVLAFNGGVDQNHIEMLKDTGLLYNDLNQLYMLIYFLKGDKDNKISYYHIGVLDGVPIHYNKLVEEFTPEKVMQQFNKVFLNE